MNFFCKLFSYSFSRLYLSRSLCFSRPLALSVLMWCVLTFCEWLCCSAFLASSTLFLPTHTRTHTSPTTTMCGVHSFRFLYLILYSSALLLLSLRLSVVAGARHKHHVRTYYLYSSQINPFNMMILLQCSLNASLLHDRHKILCLCKVSRL